MEAEKKAFKITKREIGFVLGIVVFLLVKFLPLAELSSTVELTVGGQTCLALTLATVVFWACGVAQPGFVGLLYCALLVLFKVCVDDTGAASISATVASTFSSWTKATMWLVIGAYLIASAVKESGLGERIAYAFMLKFVRDAKSLIISIFALTFVLSLLIPHPFPRAFLILAVVSVIAESAGYGDDDKGKLGFLVFAAAAPGSMFFLTGDSTLNPLVAQYSAEAGGMSPSFVDWFLYMSVPMLVALLCTLFLGLFLFKPSKELVYDREQIVAKQAALGKLSVKEIRTMACHRHRAVAHRLGRLYRLGHPGHWRCSRHAHHRRSPHSRQLERCRHQVPHVPDGRHGRGLRGRCHRHERLDRRRRAPQLRA